MFLVFLSLAICNIFKVSVLTCRISPRAPKSIRSAIVSRDLPVKVKNPEVDSSRSNLRSTILRQRDSSAQANRNDTGYIHQSGSSLPPVRNILDFDSSSDNSSLFSNSTDEVASSTDSNRESNADDFSEYIFGYNAFFRHSDSDTSSSSSSSSSPEYTKRSPLSNLERYASALPDDNAHSVLREDTSWAKAPHEASRAEESGSVGEVSFLHSNSSSKQVRKVVNISSRETDVEQVGRANPLDNGKSGVHLRRPWRKITD